MGEGENIPRPGSIIDHKYRVERVIGQGGMGVVLEATHLDLEQSVAIKLLLPAAAANAEASARFLREGRASARLSSQHVAKVHDTGHLPSGQPYLVMEFLHGRDLKSVIDRDGPQSPAMVVHWMLGTIEALAEAHSIGIVHRDIKPANIFLAETAAGKRIIKVLDFGISKQVDPLRPDLTATSMTVGSPLYMAPEQMRSSKSVDQRADIWAVGAVMYELLTGYTPFFGASLTEVVAEVLQSDPAPPSKKRMGVSPVLDRVVLRCLQKNRDARYRSVEELAEDLRLAATSAPLPRENPNQVPSTVRAAPPASIGQGVFGPTRTSTDGPFGRPAGLEASSQGPISGTSPSSSPTVMVVTGAPGATPLGIPRDTAGTNAPPVFASTSGPGSTHQTWQSTASIPAANRSKRGLIAGLVAGVALLGAGAGAYFVFGQETNTRPRSSRSAIAADTASSSSSAGPAVQPSSSASAVTSAPPTSASAAVSSSATVPSAAVPPAAVPPTTPPQPPPLAVGGPISTPPGGQALPNIPAYTPIVVPPAAQPPPGRPPPSRPSMW